MYIVVLKHCPYSIKAHRQLKRLQKENKIILYDTIINDDQKTDFHQMPTFPQIHYKIRTRKIKIGGSTDLEEWIKKNHKRFNF